MDKLTFIRVSFNAGDKESYKKVHQSDDFDKVVENLKYAVKLKKKEKFKNRYRTSNSSNSRKHR